MLDRRLRSVKERVLSPVLDRVPDAVSPNALTAAGFVLSLAAGAAAWRQLSAVAVLCWLVGRMFDGMDGALARRRGTASDLGGYGDLLLDTIGYAVVPIGIAAGAGDRTTWAVVAVLVATFYVNSVSWLMLSALLEKRASGSGARSEQTSVTMPTGLIEGSETIVLFTLALAVPSAAVWWFGAMAVGVAISIVQRGAAARRLLC